MFLFTSFKTYHNIILYIMWHNVFIKNCLQVGHGSTTSAIGRLKQDHNGFKGNLGCIRSSYLRRDQTEPLLTKICIWSTSDYFWSLKERYMTQNERKSSSLYMFYGLSDFVFNWSFPSPQIRSWPNSENSMYLL